MKRSTRGLSWFPAVALCISLIASEAFACRCKEVSVDEGLRRSHVVFVGRLTKMEMVHRSTQNPGDPPQVFLFILCTFTGAEILKGEEVKDKTISVLTSPHGPACGYPFTMDQEYLVYAISRDADFETGICDRTKLLADMKLKPGHDGSSYEHFALDDSGAREAATVRAMVKQAKSKG